MERLAAPRACKSSARAYAHFSLVFSLFVLWLLAIMNSRYQVRDLIVAVAVSPLALLCLRSLRNFDFAGISARVRKPIKKHLCAASSFLTAAFAFGRQSENTIVDMVDDKISAFYCRCDTAIFDLAYTTISLLSAHAFASFAFACRTTKTIINMVKCMLFASFAFRCWLDNAYNTWAEAALSGCFSTSTTISTLVGGVLDEFEAHKMLPKDNGWRAWYDRLGIIPGGICFVVLCIATIPRLVLLFVVFLFPVVHQFLCVRLQEFVTSLAASLFSSLVDVFARLFAGLVVGFDDALKPRWWPYPGVKYYILKNELRKAPPRGRSWFGPCCGRLRAFSVGDSKPHGAGPKSKARDARLDFLGRRSELGGSGTAHDDPPCPIPSVYTDPVSERGGHHVTSPILKSAPPPAYISDSDTSTPNVESDPELTGIFARILKRGISKGLHCKTAQPLISTPRAALRPSPRLPARHLPYIKRNGKLVPAFNLAGARVIKEGGLKREVMTRRRQLAPTPVQQPVGVATPASVVIIIAPSAVVQHIERDEIHHSAPSKDWAIFEDSAARDNSATQRVPPLPSSASLCSASPCPASSVLESEAQAPASMGPIARIADFEGSPLESTPEPESTPFVVALDIKPSTNDVGHTKSSSYPVIPQDTGIVDNPAALPASAALSPPTSESAPPKSTLTFDLGAPAPPPTSQSFGNLQARNEVDHAAAPFQQSFVVDTPMSDVPAPAFPSGQFLVPSFSVSPVDPEPRVGGQMIDVTSVTSDSAPLSSFSTSGSSTLPQEMDLDTPSPPASTPSPPANNEMEVDSPVPGTAYDEQQHDAVPHDDDEMMDAGSEVGLDTCVHTPVNKEEEMEQCFHQPSAPNQTPFGAAFGTSFGNGNLQAQVVGSITSWQPSTYGAETVGQQQSYGSAPSASPSGFAFSSGNQHISTPFPASGLPAASASASGTQFAATPFPASGLPAGPDSAAGTQSTSAMHVLGNGNPQSEVDRSVPTFYLSHNGPPTVVNQESNNSALIAPPSELAFAPGALNTSTPLFTSGQPQEIMSPQEQEWLTKLLEQVSSDAMTDIKQSATPPTQSSSEPSVQQGAPPTCATSSTYHAPGTSAPSQSQSSTLPSAPTHHAPATSAPPQSQDLSSPAPSVESQSSSADVAPPQNPSLAQSATPAQEVRLSKDCISNYSPEAPRRVLRKKVAPLKRRGGNAPVACPMPTYQPPPVDKALPTAPPSGKSLAGLFLTVDDTKTDIFTKDIDKYVKYRRICADADRRREKKEKIVVDFVEKLMTGASDGTFAVSFSTLIRSYRRCLQSFANGNSHHYLCLPAAAALKVLGKDGKNLREEWPEEEYVLLLNQIACLGHPSDVSADVLVLGKTDRPSIDLSDRPSLAWPMVFWALKLWIVSADFEDVDFQRDQMEDACEVAGDMLRMLIEMPKSALNLQEEEDDESEEDDEEESFDN